MYLFVYIVGNGSIIGLTYQHIDDQSIIKFCA